MTLDEVLLGVKNQSNIDISCSHSIYKILYLIRYSKEYNNETLLLLELLVRVPSTISAIIEGFAFIGLPINILS